jgi:broad specificity phosphatase PhoE
MHLIFIRHCEPDYKHDSLTEKGFREAELLSRRVARWNVTDFYCSPLGRAKATAAPSLDKTGRSAVILDWLKEFDVRLKSDDGKTTHVVWDRMPSYLDNARELYSADQWKSNDLMKSCGAPEYYDNICKETDSLLARYGYFRDGIYYRTEKDSMRDATVVFFCHLGISCAILSHIINCAPHVLWQGFFLAPSSVTISGSEERENGYAQFRIQTMGDTSHLISAGEPVSYYGYFTDPFQG